jgi:hypothetical protein
MSNELLTNDCISRQAALDAVNDCGICIQKILDLPSAEPNWVPVKERMCDEYCQFPHLTLRQQLIEAICNACPLNELEVSD